ALSRAVARHAGAVGKARARGRMRPEDAQRALDSLSVSRTLNGAAGKDLILEAVLEDLELKERIFADAAEHLAEDAIFATNTSSLSLQDLQRDMKHPELLVGLHFFNPPERMPLVEVVHREGTSKKGLARVARLASDLGKFPVLVRDCPGFLVNRCLAPYLAQGVAMLEEGIDPERIDRIAEDFGLPMGPLRLIDEIGWDIAAKVCDVLSEAYPDRMSASELFQVVAGEGLLGRKSGQGVYSYGKKGKTSLNKRFKTLVKTGGHLRPGSGMDDREVLDRLLLPLVAEAFRCLEDGIVASEEEIDLAMIMGTGFPPHLGGPLRWARDRGLEAIRESIEKLSGKTGLRVADSRTLTGKAGSTPARASEAVTADPASAAVENEEPDPENEKKDALEVSPVAGKEPEETTG
ncbi:MAG: 3-hydroxyacyl-CoA dehydrogenase NAD-binding domain-containing protein, partial [Planctomycetota bacterium]